MISIIAVIALVLVVIFKAELIEPEATIQCVSAPCHVPNLTIIEWITQQF